MKAYQNNQLASLFSALFFALFFFFSSSLLFAQELEETKGPDRYTLSANYGYLLAHRQLIEGLATAHAKGVTGEIQWFSNGRKRWHWLYNRPVWAVQAQFLDLGNANELGQQYALAMKCGFPIGSTHKASEFRFYSGAGVGYSTKKWDLTDNLNSLLIGSHFNVLVTLGIEAHSEINSKTGPHYGIQLTHQSNAAFQMPNLGTNVLTAFIGASLSPNGRPEMETEGVFTAHLPQQNNHFISVAGGIKEILSPGGSKYGIYTIAYNYERRRNWKTGFLGRIEAIVDYSMGYYDNPRIPSASNNELQPGVALGLAKYFGRLSMNFMMGSYLRERIDGKGPFYHRIIARYQFASRWEAHAGLRTHWAKADQPEVGIHFRIR